MGLNLSPFLYPMMQWDWISLPLSIPWCNGTESLSLSLSHDAMGLNPPLSFPWCNGTESPSVYPMMQWDWILVPQLYKPCPCGQRAICLRLKSFLENYVYFLLHSKIQIVAQNLESISIFVVISNNMYLFQDGSKSSPSTGQQPSGRQHRPSIFCSYFLEKK